MGTFIVKTANLAIHAIFQYSPSKGKAHVVAAAIRKTVNETIGEFEKSKSIVK